MCKSDLALVGLLGIALSMGVGCSDDGGNAGNGGSAGNGGAGGEAGAGGETGGGGAGGEVGAGGETGGGGAGGETGGGGAGGETGGGGAGGETGGGGAGGETGGGGAGGMGGSGGGMGGSGGVGCTVPAPVDATGIPMACRNSFNQAVSTFPIDLTNVNTNGECIEAGQAVDFIIDPVIALDTAFLQAAGQTLCDLGTFLTEADVTSAQVSIDAIAGANCTPELAVLSPVPQTIILDITLDGTCGSGGVVTVNSGISVPLPQTTLSCTAGTAGSEVQICSTGEVPLAISLTVPAPPPAYQETYVGVSVGEGAITVGFACNTSSTTNPPPGQENEIGCVLGNPTPSTPDGQSCAEAVGDGDVGETPFPTSDCNTEEGPPTEPQTCDVFGSQVPCSGTCDTVPVGVDPSGVCATFLVQ